MIGSAVGKIWRFGRLMTAKDPNGEERGFQGFLEHLTLSDGAAVERGRAGILQKERFRLIAEPEERFACGTATRVLCGGAEYRVLSIREVYVGGELSHRECILKRVCGVEGDA